MRLIVGISVLGLATMALVLACGSSRDPFAGAGGGSDGGSSGLVGPGGQVAMTLPLQSSAL